ncbi:MAG: hypothetical protein IJ864_02495 [Alphaproteobacteria bacterium]|nr:hypothetical protein [Alphaproteobacteria bacterium]
MSKFLFRFLIAAIGGMVIFVGGILLGKFSSINCHQALGAGFFTMIGLYCLLSPVIWLKIRHIFCELDWAEECGRIYDRIPVVYRHSFWILFGFINLAFLFHTINFMWGNEDWAAVRYAVNPEESLARGAFAAYWLQELLFEGKILPVINNLWAFAGLSLAGVLLAIYWRIPRQTWQVVLIGLIATVTPYALAVLYSVKTSLGVLFLPAIVLMAVLLAERRGQNDFHTYFYNIISVFLFVWALGVYMPVINLIAIAFLGRILLSVITDDMDIKAAAEQTKQGIANFTAAVMIYWLILLLLREIRILAPLYVDSFHVANPLWRLPQVLSYAFLQFVQPLPFMDIAYKICYTLFALFALFAFIFKAPSAKVAVRGLALLPLLLLASVWALAFATLPETQLVQSGFLGMPFLFALLFAMVLSVAHEESLLRRIVFVFSILLIFMNFIRIAYAEKVWKFGWDAETKLAERIITRLEKMPEFDINRQYKLLQIGEKSLRSKYYRRGPFEINNGELLGYAFYPAGKAKDAYNFFYQTDFLSDDVQDQALKIPEIRQYLLQTARAWPAPESLFIYGSYIVFVLDEVQLALVQKKLDEY